jgi:hypothetical protein
MSRLVRAKSKITNDHRWNEPCSGIAVMTRLGLLSMLALAPACLFVGDVNERPSVQVSALTRSTTLGVPITLDTHIDDDQSDGKLTVIVHDDTGAVIDDPCVVGVTALGTSGSYSVLFWRVGTYTIETIPTDRYGAVGSSASVVLQATDGPPTFAGDDVLHPLLAPAACTSLYPTGVVIPISFEGMVRDPEQSWRPPPPQCTNQLPAPIAYTWRIVSGPSGTGTLGHSTGGLCAPTPFKPATSLDDDDAVVCFYPDPGLPTGTPSVYMIELDATDGANPAIQTSVLSLGVIGDAPACLNAIYPNPGSYVVDRDTPTVFQAIGVDDVAAAATLTFTWSIERPGDSVYTPLGATTSAADDGGRLVFDPSALGLSVGDDLKLRVEVADPANPPPTCDAADDMCVVSTCAAAPATSCPRRATWSVEVR